MSRLCIIPGLVALMACNGAPASAETLREAVEAALAGNPSLAAAAARQDALAESPEQARAQGRLSASADTSGGYSKFDYGKGGASTVTAALPVWTGGRVSYAVNAARGDVAAGEEGLRDTRAALILQVVSVYAELLFDQQSVAITRADIELLEQQVAEARARFRLGKGTMADVSQLETQLASARATLADVQTTLATSEADYRAIAGHAPGELAQPSGLAALPATPDRARELALASNPQYLQSVRATDAASARIGEARAGGAPSVSLGGSYGYGLALGQGGEGKGFVHDASVGVTLSIPVLNGGLVSSQERAASARFRAARFDADAAAREAVRAADTAWANLTGARARAAANRKRVEAADLALRAVRAEYGFDLRSTLDVLLADESLRSAQLALARSRSDELVAQAALLRAAGELELKAFPEGAGGRLPEEVKPTPDGPRADFSPAGTRLPAPARDR